MSGRATPTCTAMGASSTIVELLVGEVSDSAITGDDE
jgi:hypothetical protein